MEPKIYTSKTKRVLSDGTVKYYESKRIYTPKGDPRGPKQKTGSKHSVAKELDGLSTEQLEYVRICIRNVRQGKVDRDQDNKEEETV